MSALQKRETVIAIDRRDEKVIFKKKSILTRKILRFSRSVGDGNALISLQVRFN